MEDAPLFLPLFLKFPLSLLSSIPLRLRKALTHSLRLPFFFTRVSRSGRDGWTEWIEKGGRRRFES